MREGDMKYGVPRCIKKYFQKIRLLKIDSKLEFESF